jgi:ABC-type Zn uptake system ZnuABC Zn-binding protein ZnuA
MSTTNNSVPGEQYSDWRVVINTKQTMEDKTKIITYQAATSYLGSDPPLQNDNDTTVPTSNRPGYRDIQAFTQFLAQSHESMYYQHSDTETKNMCARLQEKMKAKRDLHNVDLLKVTSEPHPTLDHTYDFDLEVFTKIPESAPASTIQA